MKPTVISAANATSSANSVGGTDAPTANAINVPVNHEFSPHYPSAEANANASSYGSPNSHGRQQQPQSHQIPAHFQQGFGFEPDMDMDMDMFPRGRLGRMHHDPFSGFGTSHFGFPQFGSMGRRRMPASSADAMDDDGDFFNRLPTEFRQYIPEGFGHRRSGGGTQQQMPTQQQHYPYHGQNYVPGSTPPSNYGGVHPQSPSKKVCDAAIQTEDPAQSQDQVDHAVPSTAKPTDNLNQHGLRNTVDMGVKATPESEQHGPRAHSAPPPEQMQQNNSGRRVTPPQQTQFGTQTSPQAASANVYQKAYYPPQQQAHPQQKQQTPPPSSQQQPQTPGGTYVRTIPIFVEGRSEPIINAHKEIPNQNAPPPPSGTHAAHATARAKAATTDYSHPHPPHPQQQQPQPQQQHHHAHPQRPAPLNTQQQPQSQDPQQQAAGGVPPQTPHTMDSINKIQDIQRDVLELMGKVEKFTGRRQDKEYVYLDEMLTRNLLKLDTIDTNGKDSIRLARKEAIKCIQASINVLEAKAEENAKTAQANAETVPQPASNEVRNISTDAATSDEAMDQGEATAIQQTDAAVESNVQEPIPLPPPSENKSLEAGNEAAKEASPMAAAEPATEPSNNSATVESK